jgi:hypothetical protein
MRHVKKHYSNVRGNPPLIGRFAEKRGYFNLTDLLDKPFYGKVIVVDAQINQKVAELTYPELRKKYLG